MHRAVGDKTVILQDSHTSSPPLAPCPGPGRAAAAHKEAGEVPLSSCPPAAPECCGVTGVPGWGPSRGRGFPPQAAWLGINIFLFTYYFLFFDRDERYFYTRAILGVSTLPAWAHVPLGALLQWDGGCSPFFVLFSSSLPLLRPSPQPGIASYWSLSCPSPALHHPSPASPCPSPQHSPT